MLYLISTPIGNLNDISLRAIEVLNNVDYIFAEDTRNTSKLLNFLKCDQKCKSLHEHNEQEVTSQIIKMLSNSDVDIALVADAGTPTISDPGYHLIQKCIENNIEFTLIPGPSSVINALVLSGLPTSSFSFLGFIPRKKSQKIQFFQSLKKENNTIIAFESAKRIENTLSCIAEEYSKNKKISLCREMTKLYENIERGTAISLLKKINNGEIILKGEFVMVIEPFSLKDNDLIFDNKIYKSLLDNMPAKDAAKIISMITKENKRDIYKKLLELK
ncbi:MAG: 16S rRNA (cytidine(1402)-2'-O)-methyltransferase [SAR86 cluster bacterium]|nr:16S rRNA (cytidine(1402)-2'-O)-methyltransferase [SAR86 cluster bacterium]